jgi:hypothetical protein
MNTQVTEQGQAPSVESRAVAALFGEQKEQPRQQEPAPQQMQEPAPETEETAAPEAEAPTAEELFEIEVDGEKFALPKKLEKAVLQERDYTQKSQSLAEQRRAFELLHEQAKTANFRQAFEQEVSAELQQLQAYDAVLKQPIDWNSMTTEEAFRKKLQVDTWKTEREELARKVSNSHQQWTQKQEAALKDLRSKARDIVSKRIPNWSEATEKAIREHALTDGYTEAEMNDIVDPRHTLTLWKAYQFDQLKAKATKTVADVKTVKTTSSNPMPQSVKEKLAFHKVLNSTTPGSKERSKAVEARVGSFFAKR